MIVDKIVAAKAALKGGAVAAEKITEGISSIRSARVGNAAEDIENAHLTARSEMGMEAKTTIGKIWFDLWNGVNKMIRPSLVILAVWSLMIYFNKPARGAEITLAIKEIPWQLWGIYSGIFLFYFGSRHLEKRMAKK